MARPVWVLWGGSIGHLVALAAVAGTCLTSAAVGTRKNLALDLNRSCLLASRARCCVQGSQFSVPAASCQTPPTARRWRKAAR